MIVQRAADDITTRSSLDKTIAAVNTHGHLYGCWARSVAVSVLVPNVANDVLVYIHEEMTGAHAVCHAIGRRPSQ